MEYKIHELFSTFQGEGVHMGKPAFFIRLFGCSVACPWCDSAGTWHPSWVPKHVQRMTEGELVEAVGDSQLVVLTGGEPTIHDLAPLCNALHAEGKFVHLETSGAFPIRGYMDWITLSPKKWKPPLAATVRLASEFKIIVEEPSDIGLYSKMIQDLWQVSEPYLDEVDPPIWLHPEWSQRNNLEVLGAICDAVKARKLPYRAGWQLHKLFQVDFKDNRARPPVPLGGDEAKGF